MTEEKKPIIIFDTDMDTDCDDAGAFLMLINAHMCGEINLIGVMADSVCEFSAPFCEKVLSYYGLDIPVGEIYSNIANYERFFPYQRHQKSCENVAYNKILSERHTDYESTATLYDRLLKGAPDKSVTVLCVGMLTAVFNAIKNDKELFYKKVNKVVVMGNPYKENDFNFSMDKESAKGFFDLCPSPVFISYAGTEIITGNNLKNTLPMSNPIRQAYEIWSGDKGRSSWDLVATLYAINFDESLFEVIWQGQIEYNIKDKIAELQKGTRDTIIKPKCTNEKMAEILNGLLQDESYVKRT